MTDPSSSLVPVSDEQAKAIQEVSKAVQEAVKTLRGFGGFLRGMIGTVPEDVVALLGGNWLKVRRAENPVRILEKTRERLRARQVETPEPASLSIALPILVAAADESRISCKTSERAFLRPLLIPRGPGHFGLRS